MAEKTYKMSTRWETSNSTNAEAKGLNKLNPELTEDRAKALPYFILYDTDLFVWKQVRFWA